MLNYSCLLCESGKTDLLFSHKDALYGERYFYLCQKCGLLFADPASRLNRQDEKYRYDQHNNLPDDPQYLSFLNRLAEPLSLHLKKGASGLDYGCGPACVMGRLIKKEECGVDYYDPFYYPNKGLLKGKYDFIMCSEAAEHFFSPKREFELFDRLLNKQGHLGVMTSMFNDKTNLKEWWYIKDPTHVCFYQQKTFKWIADKMRWEVIFPADNVVIFVKSMVN